jgi:MFS family permease
MRLSGLRRGITRNVAALALVSLLTDVSSEMLVYVIPLFLANVLAVTPSVIGLIEGTAESISALLKLASGWLSDRLGRRKVLVGIGYGASVASKTVYLLATSWPLVLVARVGDRLGKGIRTAPRDALIADSTEEAYRGRAFGFQRALDTTGSFLGVLIAVVVVGATEAGATTLDGGTFRTLVMLALVPGVLAVLVIGVGVRDVRRARPAEDAAVAVDSRLARILAHARQLPAPFWLFVAANTLFSLGNSSDAFLALRTQNLGVAVRDLLLMIVAFNATNALVSFPAGVLSDRIGRRAPIAAAWLIYAASYAGFALATGGAEAAGLWILYGAYYGINEAVGRAFVADVAPADMRGSGYGILNFAVAVAVLPASVIAGVLWDAVSPSATFWFGAACAIAATLVLGVVRPLRVQRPATP